MRAHRALLVSRLGCAPCDGGRLHTLGPYGAAVGPLRVPGSQLVLASRYGGYVWR